MKKFYLKKSAIVASLVALVAVVSCGVKIASVTFSSHSIQQGETVTITTTFDESGRINLAKGIRLMYGIQVPEDWSSAEPMTAKNNKYSGSTLKETVDVKTENCEEYATILEYCFPKDGYKWIAYVSTDEQDLEGEDTDNSVLKELVISTVKLKAGQKMDTYKLTIVAGCATGDLSRFLEGNAVNVNTTFGCKIDPASEEGDNVETIGAIEFWGTNEYLFNASTMSSAEYNSYRERMAVMPIKVTHKSKVGEALVDKSLPIVPKIDNLTEEIDMSVTVSVNAGIDEAVADGSKVNVVAVDGRIEVEAEGGIATVYDMTGSIIDTKVVNGAATLEARKGVCIVRVVNGARATVQKVVVK